MKFSQLFRIYINHSLVKNQIIYIVDHRLHYLSSVIRLKKGQYIRMFNEHDGEFIAQVVSINKKEITFKVIDNLRVIIEEPTFILALCIIKLDRFLEAIRAAVQLGVTKIIPVISSRVQLKTIPRDKIENILQQSTEQSERLKVPLLADPISLEELVKKTDIEQIVFANENEIESQTISTIKCWRKNLCVLIGPEGGFTDQEIKSLDQPNIMSVSLGATVMRTEIAAIVALACVKMMRQK